MEKEAAMESSSTTSAPAATAATSPIKPASSARSAIPGGVRWAAACRLPFHSAVDLPRAKKTLDGLLLQCARRRIGLAEADGVANVENVILCCISYDYVDACDEADHKQQARDNGLLTLRVKHTTSRCCQDLYGSLTLELRLNHCTQRSCKIAWKCPRRPAGNVVGGLRLPSPPSPCEKNNAVVACIGRRRVPSFSV